MGLVQSFSCWYPLPTYSTLVPPHPAPTPPLQAQLLSLCENSVLYLWSLEEVVPEVLHKITFSQDNSYNK